jgi:uncharacterized repeat protein (TIGR03803 family)
MTTTGGANNLGVIFSYDPVSGIYTDIWDFNGTEGQKPYGSLLLASDGNLYGMTNQGGLYGNGNIFQLNPTTYAFIDLVDFTGNDGAYPGANPQASLIQASDGNLYGMTEWGGANGGGEIFRYTPGSAFTDIYDFDGTTGWNAIGSLFQASDGNLYGTTSNGGANGDGVIFEYNLITGSLMKLGEFDGPNGSYPG